MLSKRLFAGGLALACVAACLSVPAVAAPNADALDDPAVKLAPETVPGLEKSVRVRRDLQNAPHVFALNDHDALFMLGYVHAQDRFFQMDVLRRTFSGTLAALVGEAALAQDVQFRTLGLRRGADATLPAVMSLPSGVWLEAYVEGVNAWIARGELPPEYGALELTSLEPWTAVDSLTLAKGLSFGLSFDLDDIDYSLAAGTFAAVGAQAGFNGLALFSEDLYRSAPFDPTVSIPELAPPVAPPPPVALNAPASIPGDPSAGTGRLSDYLDARALALLHRYRERAGTISALAKALTQRDAFQGSNWWVASGAVTDSGLPLLANDPHLALDTPATFYEAQMRVRTNGDTPFNIVGVSFPGTPGIIQGCNPWICWGSTVNALDVTDVYLEQLVLDPASGLPTHTLFRGTMEPVVLIPQAYAVNVVGDGVADNLVDSGLGPLDGGLTIVVPRRNNGPIVDLDLSDPTAPTAISVQYTGWGPTFEIQFIYELARATTIEAFRDALQSFDVGSQNWAVASRDGSIAYFTSAEMPLREDLQLLGAPDGGMPPWMIRDGSGTLMHEWLPASTTEENRALPYEVLPFDEMPQVVNPASGYILNCNNDPVGTTLDNNPLNQLRVGGQGLFYLSPGYATGLRQGRLARLVDAEMAGDGTFSVDDFKRYQANAQLLDAEVLVPYLSAAFAAAGEAGANPALAALGADADVAEAIARLGAWDFSTPTGIPEGYDAGDALDGSTMPNQMEIDAAVAATIYSVWRGQIVRSVIDGTLAPLGLDGFAPGSSLSIAALRHHLDSFDVAGGVGASGLDFFAVPGIDDAATARDVKLLSALRAALDLLASDEFAAAFGNSTDQDDYLWGKLHRITFDHPLGQPFSVPAAGGLANVADDLPGLARQGGFGALDASSHSARADGVNDFTFGSGPSRRFVGTMFPNGPFADQVIPGGTSGVIGSPFQADQLRLWLVNEYHPLLWSPDDVVAGSLSFQQFFPPVQ
ncbi:MAG: penicillin acylase family protein [Acidobacteriota bacterium]